MMKKTKIINKDRNSLSRIEIRKKILSDLVEAIQFSRNMKIPRQGFLVIRDKQKENGEFRTSLVFVNFEFHVCRGVYLYSQEIFLKKVP